MLAEKWNHGHDITIISNVENNTGLWLGTPDYHRFLGPSQRWFRLYLRLGCCPVAQHYQLRTFNVGISAEHMCGQFSQPIQDTFGFFFSHIINPFMANQQVMLYQIFVSQRIGHSWLLSQSLRKSWESEVRFSVIPGDIWQCKKGQECLEMFKTLLVILVIPDRVKF